MPTSFNRRLLLSISAVTKIALVVTALAVGLFIGKGADVEAAYNPITVIELSNDGNQATTNTAHDMRNLLVVSGGDYNFGAFSTTTPPGTQYTPGALGDIGATLSSDTFLGIGNGPCNTNLPVTFTMLEASINNAGANEIDQIDPAITGPLGAFENFMTDEGTAPGANNGGGIGAGVGIDNNIPASVERYPGFLNDIFENVTPVRRLTGNTVVSSTAVTLSFVTFTASSIDAQFNPPHPFGDISAGWGFVTFTVLQNPVAPTAPGSITDFCTPLTSDAVTLGTTEDNTCRDAHPSVPASCDTPNELSNPPSGGNDTGSVALRTPATAGTYWYMAYTQSARDADGDGYENSFDTCPYTTNSEDARVTKGPDSDNIDSSCDTAPGTNDGDNKDGDSLGNPARDWANAGDNCPQLVNNTNQDSEGITPGPTYAASAPRGGPKGDSIGDVCDTQPTVANGQFHAILAKTPMCIYTGADADGDNDGFCVNGGGGGLPNDPNDANANVTPETRSLVFELPLAHSGAGVSSHVRGNPGVATGLGSDQCDPSSVGSSDHCFGSGSVANSGASVNGNDATTGGSAVAYAGTGQPYQECNNGLDEDGDTLIDLLDPGCAPGGLTGTDTDGDGYTDRAEMYIGTDIMGRCEVNTGGTNTKRSTDWPSDLDSTTGFPLPSQDKITVTDITAFLVPPRLNTNPGQANYNPRFDLVPGITFPFATWIAVNDLTALISGSSGTPPMLGVKAFGGPDCTAHPTYSD